MMLSSYVHWLDTPSGLTLAIMADNSPLIEARWADFLSPREVAEGRLKKNAATWRSWLLGRLAAKAAGGRLLGCPVTSLEILKNEVGQPELYDLKGHRLAPWVSISHTGATAVAVAGFNPVGLDLEPLDRRISSRLEGWAFSPEERVLIEKGFGSEYPGALSLWCAREAAAKFWGLGLLNHLDLVRVQVADWRSGHLEVAWLGAEYRRAEVGLMKFRGFLLALAATGQTAR